MKASFGVSPVYVCMHAEKIESRGRNVFVAGEEK